MDPMDPEGHETQATQQATQTVLDPRRLGKQNSGFSDDDIADIICLLLPRSESSRAELRDMSLRRLPHIIDADDASHPNAELGDSLNTIPDLDGEPAIVLRLSAKVKDPLQGFTFGRNPLKCDVCFQDDPVRRLSNVHFRVYLNEHKVLMLEDTSINGTVVDGTLLKGKLGDRPKPGEQHLSKQRTLIHGSRIKVLMHNPPFDLRFIVQILHREGDYEQAYRRNLARYMNHLKQLRGGHDHVDAAKTITPGPGGHVSKDCPFWEHPGTDDNEVDLFPVNETKRTTRANARFQVPDDTTEEPIGRLSLEWNGSNKYNRVERIGKGAFATVYRVTGKYDGKPFAAKELDKWKFMKNGVLDQKVENEMKIMKRAKHPNIVEYIEHIDWNNRLLIIIMEFVPHGDLATLIGDNRPLKEDIVQQMASQMLSALAYLHANNITHRDVKPENILCESYDPFSVKLTDFGLSKMVDTEKTFLKTFCGTLLYCAPEVYNEFAEYDEYGHRHPRNRQRRRPVGQRYDHAIDIWSLGGVLYYALSATSPFPAKNGISYTELLHQIMTKSLNTTPLNKMNISRDSIDFLSRMLQRRPEKRATIEELRSHPWLAGTEFSQQSNKDDIDEELQKEASQLSLRDNEFPEQVPAGSEEINEAETEYAEQRGADTYDDAPSEDDESQKENYTFGPMNQQTSRLFGEVGSSGVIPSTRPDLPGSGPSLDGTEILYAEIKDSYDSEGSTPRQPRMSQPTPRGAIPAALTQSRSRSASRSVGELNNMTFDPESQDLEGAESQLENLNMKSLAASNGRSLLSSFNVSKRKPSYDTSDEFDNTPKARPPAKKLRSDSLFDDTMSCDEESDQSLYAQIPPLSRIVSSRQIDKPVNKNIYWDARDSRTWHLKYPEMTQLQHDAFASAAEARGEKFAPGRSRLWELAMRHFPPADGRTPSPELGSSASDFEVRSFGRRSDVSGELGIAWGVPGGDYEEMASILPPENATTVPAQMRSPFNRVVASLESTPNSPVPGVSIPINQAMVSWGRASETTHIYTDRMESKVPKHALKILLWKDGYEPSRNFQPWNNPADDFHFYISTKATRGIKINTTDLPSDESKHPEDPSRYWIRLHDGDVVVFWGSGHSDAEQQGKLIFRCNWGGSSRPRYEPAELVPPEVATYLDASCSKAERYIEKLALKDRKLQEASLEALERQKYIERERLRSREFEAKRLEACRVLAMRASRRNSPAIMPQVASSEPPAMTTGGRAMIRHMSVPALRHAASGMDAHTL